MTTIPPVGSLQKFLQIIAIFNPKTGGIFLSITFILFGVIIIGQGLSQMFGKSKISYSINKIFRGLILIGIGWFIYIILEKIFGFFNV